MGTETVFLLYQPYSSSDYPEGADVAYLASIGIGTPAVDNLLQIDSERLITRHFVPDTLAAGSGDTWTTYSKIVTSVCNDPDFVG